MALQQTPTVLRFDCRGRDRAPHRCPSRSAAPPTATMHRLVSAVGQLKRWHDREVPPRGHTYTRDDAPLDHVRDLSALDDCRDPAGADQIRGRLKSQIGGSVGGFSSARHSKGSRPCGAHRSTPRAGRRANKFAKSSAHGGGSPFCTLHTLRSEGRDESAFGTIREPAPKPRGTRITGADRGSSVHRTLVL